MKIIIFVVCQLIVLASASKFALTSQLTWEQYKAQFGKIYENKDDEQTHFQTFLKNLEVINKHNRDYENGLVSYKMGINQFTDMTKAEFKSHLIPPHKIHVRAVRGSGKDWRDDGVVTPARNQGSCGAASIFAVTGALESQIAIKTGVLHPIDEKAMTCSSNGESAGCGGGYLNVNGNFTCVYEPSLAVKISCDFISVQSGEDNIIDALDNIGPLAVAIVATDQLLMYSSGILDDPSCNNGELNHALLLVGYGADYWLLKNSWGPEWGEDGYIRIARKQNGCGVTAGGSYPIVHFS